VGFGDGDDHRYFHPPCHAANWATGVSGNFSDGTKWTGGVAPSTTSDSAGFILSGTNTYTVTFTNSPTIGATTVSTNNNVTFVTNGTPARSRQSDHRAERRRRADAGQRRRAAADQHHPGRRHDHRQLQHLQRNDVDSSALFNVGTSGNGTATIDGSGSTLTCAGR